MTVIGEAFIEISPQAKGFEGKVVAAANEAAKKAAGALDSIPVVPDATELVADVDRAAEQAAERAEGELRDVEVHADAEQMAADVRKAADKAATAAEDELDGLRTNADTTGLTEQVKRAADRAADSATKELGDIPVAADPGRLDASVVSAARAAARRAATELSNIPGGVDADTFTTRVAAAANEAALKAQARLDRIPVGLDVGSLEVEAANAAARAAAAAAGRLDAIPMEADGARLVRDVDQAMDRSERRVDQGAKKMAADTKGALDGLGGAVSRSFALLGVGQVLFSGIQEAREAQAVTRQTEAVIRSTGGAAQVTAKQVKALADNIQAKTAVEDEAVEQGANLLLTFTNVRNEVGKGNDIFNQSTQVLVDMAAAMGNDVSSGAIQLGKALNDPVAGVSALAEVGVTFTQGQKDMIRTMVEAGNVAGAQRVILAELTKEFGGSAAAQADDLDRLGVKYDEFKERVGRGALEVIGVLSDIPGPILAIGAGLGGLAVTAVGVSKVVDAVGNLSSRLDDASIAGRPLGGIMGAIGKGAAVAGGLTVGAFAIDAVTDALERLQHGPAPRLPEMANSLVRFGESGKVAGALSKEFGGDLGKLGDKLKDLEGGTGSGGILGNIFSPNTRSRVSDAKRDIDALDKSLAGLVAQGDKDIAAGILDQLAREAGVSVAEVKRHLDDYRGALANVDTEQRLAASSSGALGAAASDTADQVEDETTAVEDAAAALDTFKSALDDALGVQVNARQSAIDYVDAVQNLRDSVGEHGRTLDLNTEAGRRNREAILGVIEGARDHIGAMADEGAGADALRATYATHRGELANVLQQLGFNKKESSDYLGILDRVPESVFTELKVKDEEAKRKVAEFKAQLEALRPFFNMTVPFAGQLGRREHGGPVRKGEPYVVGEKRPELFVPDASGYVYPRVPEDKAKPTTTSAAISTELVIHAAAALANLPTKVRAELVLDDSAARRQLGELQRLVSDLHATVATTEHTRPTVVSPDVVVHAAAVYAFPPTGPPGAPAAVVGPGGVVVPPRGDSGPPGPAGTALAAVRESTAAALVESMRALHTDHRSVERVTHWTRPPRSGVLGGVPYLANGAIVQATPGGTLVNIGEGGRDEAVIPLPPGLVEALDRLARGGGGGAASVFRDLVVQGANSQSAYATGIEVVRQLRAEFYTATGGRLLA